MPEQFDLIWLGGTAGLIAYLLFSVLQFASGNWRPGKDLEDANGRTAIAVEAGRLANEATAKALEENRAWRALVRQMLLSQGMAPPDGSE